MKKLKYFIFVLLILISFYNLTSCSQKKEAISDLPGFVQIKNNQFVLNGNPYFPLAVNYRVALQTNGKQLWPSAYKGYDDGNRYRFTNRDSSLEELNNDFQLIADMGFNSIRIVGIGEQYSVAKNSDELYIRADIGNEKDTMLLFNSQETYNQYFNALNDMLQAANKAGLRVVLLSRLFHEVPATEKHWGRIMKHFQNDTTILAYDFFNEPLYFDSLE
ncbi:MAG TPA: cellulase family glycosylhydrolase, partial [Bacteroidia bacterium]|nr:cellulase family glycosylhydrolase [Bacteroidia bacterium]